MTMVDSSRGRCSIMARSPSTGGTYSRVGLSRTVPTTWLHYRLHRMPRQARCTGGQKTVNCKQVRDEAERALSANNDKPFVRSRHARPFRDAEARLHGIASPTAAATWRHSVII